VTYAAPVLTWSGALGIDQQAIVEYSLRLDTDAPVGTALRNSVIGTGPGSNCTVGPNSPCVADARVGRPSPGFLAFTGANPQLLVPLALVLLLAGALAVRSGRPRRRRVARLG
jgi:hypothetical protein